jgi:hypothetical protein
MALGHNDEGAKETTSVVCTDIPGSVSIIGRLGQPLGTIVEVKGTWRQPDPGPTPEGIQFVVQSVDGVKLDEEIAFSEGDVRAAFDGVDVRPSRRGQTWTLVVAELGGFEGIPPDALAYYEGDSVSPIRYGFATHLVCVLRRS